MAALRRGAAHAGGGAQRPSRAAALGAPGAALPSCCSRSGPNELLLPGRPCRAAAPGAARAGGRCQTRQGMAEDGRDSQRPAHSSFPVGRQRREPVPLPSSREGQLPRAAGARRSPHTPQAARTGPAAAIPPRAHPFRRDVAGVTAPRASPAPRPGYRGADWSGPARPRPR